MDQVTVGLGPRSYQIWIGRQLLAHLGEALSGLGVPRRVAVISNPTVSALHYQRLQQSLIESGFEVHLIEVPDGEEYKTLATLNDIYNQLLTRRFDRHTALIALGGGVIGDLVGFAAATFLRGVPFIQVPTTLLAQVDSSVGGKTGVNHPLGKNLIGAFYQPRHVQIDIDTLLTLPQREFVAGMAEVVKYGVIADRAFFDWLHEHRESLRHRDAEALSYAVKRSCQIKANIVELDETESSLRAILNYGHTFGHAVETLAGYGTYRHGEAVAIGMVVAAEMAGILGYCQSQDVAAIRNLLAALDLPVTPPPLPLDQCLDTMGHDKKVKDGRMHFILNRGIGACEITELQDPRPLLAEALQRLRLNKG